ncbi:hypothetical protein L209DRAFT_270896 [Thermothelomyces heterothallicus CBS 203.75]
MTTTTAASLPPAASLPTLPPAAQAATLDLLFEPSADLHAVALPALRRARPPGSYDDLVAAVRARLLELADAAETEAEAEPRRRRLLFSVLGSHPRLGEKKKKKKEEEEAKAEVEVEVTETETETETETKAGSRGGGEGQGGSALSALSAAEQSHLSAEDEELARLNREYEARFPGLRYVVWVNGRPRAEVLEDMRRRIQRGDMKAEVRTIIEAMCDIAADRARKLLQKSAE